MSLEIKIPKDIRKYREGVFFGLSIRQLVCSGVALGTAVGVYFGLQETLGQEMVSWVCVLAAAPFAIAAFFSYHGMNLEQFLWAWLRSEFLCAGPRNFRAENTYLKILEEIKQQETPGFFAKYTHRVGRKEKP